MTACPGSGGKCHANLVDRVCAKVLDGDGSPLNWGDKSFWDLTDSESTASAVKANGGDSDCISIWQLAQAIHKAGCDNVHISCEATDVQRTWSAWGELGVFDKYVAGHPLGEIAGEPVQECFIKKCNPPNRMIIPALAEVEGSTEDSIVPFMGMAVVGAAIGAIVIRFVARRPRASPPVIKPILG
jgi:hypothetical protein